ncbi:MAG: hypothetical protein LBL79_12960 [Prevotella sp.]|nr:hypothetical protein [Prevotella sp.]
MKILFFLKKACLSAGLLSLLSASGAKAQSKVEIDPGADIVSSYVWRGGKAAGASVQPFITASLSNFTLGAWGSSDISPDFSSSKGYKEADFYASYSVNRLGFTVTDYWWDGNEAFRYFSSPENGYSGHMLEGSLAYTLPESFPLTLSWNTFFLGKENKKEDGKNSYSTYIEAAYPLTVNGIDLKIAAGFTPWDSTIYGTNGFKFTNIMLGATKSIKISESFELPIFANIITNPATEDINFVFGITIK